MEQSWLLIQPWSASSLNSCKPQCSGLSQKPLESIWDLYWMKWRVAMGQLFLQALRFSRHYYSVNIPYSYFVYYRHYGTSATDSHSKQSTSLSRHNWFLLMHQPSKEEKNVRLIPSLTILGYLPANDTIPKEMFLTLVANQKFC